MALGGNELVSKKKYITATVYSDQLAQDFVTPSFELYSK